jgi:hypothetical protein
MELIHIESLPPSFRRLTEPSADGESEVRVSMYVPNYKSGRSRIWKQSRRLLAQARELMVKGLAESEVLRRLELLEEKIFLEQSHSEASGFAYFLDADRCEAQPLVVRPAPLVVVSNSFHVRPLLQSLASEPHHRMIILRDEEALSYRRDHDGVSCEIRARFPEDKTDKGKSLFHKQTAHDLDRTWHNMEGFAQEILKLQNQDPRPIALFGPEKLRKLIIEDIRAQLTRPIFVQDRSEKNLREICQLADEAYLDRLVDESPFDVDQAIDAAEAQDLLVTDIREVFRHALAGKVLSLVVTSENLAWGHVNLNSGEVELHESQLDHHDDCVIDNTVEQVLNFGGSVLFAHPENVCERRRGGVFALLRAGGQTSVPRSVEDTSVPGSEPQPLRHVSRL